MQRLAITTLLAALAAGCGSSCDQGQPPSSGAQQRITAGGDLHPLSDGDRAVIGTLVDQRLRRFGETDDGRLPVVVLADQTLPSRPMNARTPASRLSECIWSGAFRWLDRRSEWGVNLTSLFYVQNSDARLITVSPSAQATLVTVLNPRFRDASGRFNKWKLLQQFPRGSQFYQVSAPVYPTSSTALVFFHSLDAGGGFCLLVRTGERWGVKECDGWTE